MFNIFQMNLAIFTKNGKNTEHFWDLLKYHKNAKTIFLMYFEQQAAYQKKLKMTILSKLAIKSNKVLSQTKFYLLRGPESGVRYRFSPFHCF